MVAKSVDQAVVRFLAASRRIREGLVMQRQRIQDAYDAAPRIFEGEPHEWVEVSDIPANDIDYYAYELVRLDDLAGSMLRPLGSPPELVAARAAFNGAIPRMRAYRNPTTHFSNTSALDNVVVLSAAMEADRDGVSLRPMVSPLSDHDHGAALDLLRVIDALLTEKVQWSMADDPPRPLLEQIEARGRDRS